MSDTPRTDANILTEPLADRWLGGDGRRYERVLAIFARRLERENWAMFSALCKLDAIMDFSSAWSACACFVDPSGINRAMAMAAESLADRPISHAAPQGQEVCQHARLPNDRVPEPAVAAPVRKVFSPFDPNARLYAALNLLEQIYEEVNRQKWPVDSHWATAVKNVLDEHGWSA